MKNSRIVFLRWIALLVVITVTVSALLLSMATEKTAPMEVNVPPQPRYVTTLDRPRPEFRIEQLLNLDDPNNFDPDLTALLRRKRERERGMANQNATSYEQVASLSHDQKGVHDQ